MTVSFLFICSVESFSPVVEIGFYPRLNIVLTSSPWTLFWCCGGTIPSRELEQEVSTAEPRAFGCGSADAAPSFSSLVLDLLLVIWLLFILFFPFFGDILRKFPVLWCVETFVFQRVAVKPFSWIFISVRRSQARSWSKVENKNPWLFCFSAGYIYKSGHFPVQSRFIAIW